MRGFRTIGLQKEKENEDAAEIRMREHTGVDIVHPEVLVVLWSAERALLVVRSIDAAGYKVIRYISNLRSGRPCSWTIKDRAWWQFCRCSGADCTGMGKG